MGDEPVRPARRSERAARSDGGVDRARWDDAHAVSATPAFSALKRETICAALPPEVEPTTLWPAWPLDRVGAALEMRVGETLVDLACGRGEVGLWIARHLEVAWVGVDPSPVGLAIAADHLSDRPMRCPAQLVEGHFSATGLPDDAADAVLVLDALHFSPDLTETFFEVHRVLRPGRRLVIVGPQPTDPRPALGETGFTIERDEQTPGWRDVLGRFLSLAHERADVLRAELGDAVANQVLSRDINQLDHAGHGLIAARRAP